LLDYLSVEHLIQLLQVSAVNILVVPLLLFAATALWKRRIRPAGPGPDDAALGLELVVNAAGVQLSFLVQFASQHDELSVRHGVRLLAIVVLVFVALARTLHRWGFEDDGKTPTLWVGRVASDVVGILAVIGVFAGNTLGVR
jgi:hypothetical protein